MTSTQAKDAAAARDALARIASDPDETQERRTLARAALDKALGGPDGIGWHRQSLETLPPTASLRNLDVPDIDDDGLDL